jgi:hypothetical protein
MFRSREAIVCAPLAPVLSGFVRRILCRSAADRRARRRENHRFWPENPQSSPKNFVFPLIFAHFNLRYLPDLAIVPFGPGFSQGKWGSQKNSAAGPGCAGMERKLRRIGKIDGS